MTWYMRKNMKPDGPYSKDEIRDRLRSGEVQPGDLLWNEEISSWRPATEWRDFSMEDMPALQRVDAMEEGEVWVVLRRKDDQNMGPWSRAKIEEELAAGGLSPIDCVWKEGLSGWAQLLYRPEFSFAVGKLLAVSYVESHDSSPEK